MVHHPRGDDRMIAGEGAGDVLGALARAEADLLLLDIDRVRAELDRRHLHRVAGPRARLLEDQSATPLPASGAAEVGPLGQSEDLRRSAARQDRAMPSRSLTSSVSLLTMVPMPWSVSISISRACGTRPSMMCARADAAVDRVGAGAQLGDHAGADRSHASIRLAQFGRGQARHQRSSRRRHPRAGPARRSDRRSSPPPSPPRSPSPPRRR